MKDGTLDVLNERTPLATVLQDIVASYLEYPTTLFVADNGNNMIRAVNLEDFSVRTLAGQSKCGHADGKGPAALLNSPLALTADKATNTLLVSNEFCMRRITTDGVVSTLCDEKGSRDVAKSVSGAVVAGSCLFISDYSNHCILRVLLDDNNSSQLFAGTPGERGLVDGIHSKFSSPQGLATDFAGNLFVADTGNNCIRKITSAGVVSTVTGVARGHRDGPLKEALFHSPVDVAFDRRGRLLVADFMNHTIRSVDLEAGIVTTIVGRPGTRASKAAMNFPNCIVVDVATDNLFVSSALSTIHCVSSDGTVRTVCGQRNQHRHADGLGPEARFDDPHGLALL